MGHHHDHHHTHERDGRHMRGASNHDPFAGRHGERHGRHEGGRRGGRMFDHGELRVVVLALIAEQPRHGYEVIRAIEDRFGGGYSPSPGVVYPTLTLLEELGHATVTEEGGKKRYAVTDEGRAELTRNQAIADAALARMAEHAARTGRAAAPPVLRAMENLKLALRLRFDRAPMTEAQVQAIAAALDAAAVAVERS